MKNKLKKSFAAVLAAIITLSASANYSLTTANAAELGDVNIDGTVDSSDATAILIYYANALLGNNVNIDNSAADVNGDGTVDSSDATVILIYYAHNLLGENYSIADVVSGNAGNSGNSNNSKYNKAYEKVIQNAKETGYKEFGVDFAYGYILFDINHDGTDELIVAIGNADVEMYVWTIQNGKAVECGKLTSYSYLLLYDSSDNLYSTTMGIVQSDKWDNTLCKITLNGTHLTETVIHTDYSTNNIEQHGFTRLDFKR